ncbi:MAG: T9SS type A sorting domain-containing protein [Bacteroidetes bacterium]|nr:T9SS type A sorting domain-containing protein [Bacteroidota bacterium]
MKKIALIVFFISFVSNCLGQDTNPPTASCVTNFNAFLDATGSVTIATSDIDNGSVDAEGSVTLSLDTDTFTCVDAGPNPVVLTVTDGAGNTDMCNATVTVVDVIVPSAVCQAAAVTVTLDAMGNGSLTTGEIDDGSFDNCGTVFLSLSQDSFTCADLGSHSIDLTVTDLFGNSAFCTKMITVEEMMEPLQANCQDITISLDATGSAMIVAEDIDNSSTPSTGGSFCNPAVLMANQTTFSCNDVLKPLPVNELILTGIIGDTATSGRPRALELYTIQEIAVGDLSLYGLGAANPSEGIVLEEFTFPANGSPIAAGTHITVTANQGAFTTFFGEAANYVATNAANVDGNDVVSLFYNGNVIDTFGDINAVEIEAGFELGRLDRWAYTNGWAYRINNTEQNGGVFDFNDGTWAYSSPGVLGSETANPPLPIPPIPPIAGVGFPFKTYEFVPFGSTTPIAVTLTIDDGNGNVDTCIANVTIEDTIPPSFSVMNITKMLDAMGSTFVTASELYTAEAVDNCGVLRYRVEPSTFNCTSVGANSVEVTAIDVFGNEFTQTAMVTIIDSTGPSQGCADITVVLDAAGNATITPEDIIGSSEDSCGIAVQSIDIDTFDCSNLGANNVTLTLEDNNGNTTTCIGVVTITDESPPTAVCQDITVQLSASGMATISASQIDNGSNDVCSAINLSIDTTTFDCSDLGINSVILTVTDAAGNMSSCIATVTVVDIIPPMAVAADISVILNNNGEAFIVGADVDNGSIDNCAISTITVAPNSFTCTDTGAPVPVLMTVTDTDGQTATATANVTVIDNVPPVASCLDITVQLDASGNSNITASDIDGGSSASCGVVTTMIDVTSFTCADIGPNMVTLSVTNASGITTQCTAVVTVEDTVTPTVNCQDITLVLDASGQGIIDVADIDVGSSDACGIASSSLDISSFDCSNIGANNVTLTVTDANGNMAECIAVVTVLDDINPSAVCQNITVALDNNGVVTIDASQLDGGSTDFCGIASMSISEDTFSCSDIGANSVIFTVVDTSGNTDTCSAIVTIEDDTDPLAVCQNITIQLDASGNAFIDPTDIDGGSTDACGIGNISVSNNLFNCNNVGSNSVLFTVMDTSGNSDSCSAIVTVEDAIAPNMVCQDITVQLDASGVAFITVNDIDGGTNDACGLSLVTIDVNSFSCADLGTNNVTLSATDLYGNSASCTAVVTVLESIDPVIICPASQSVAVMAGDQFSIPDYFDLGLATVTDNCTNPVTILTQNPAVGTLLDPGNYTISLTAEDDSGNNDSCNFQLTVDTILGVEDEVQKNLIRLYPNPMNQILTLSSSDTAVERITLFDLTGRMVLLKEITEFSRKTTLDVSVLPAASYLIVIEGQGQVWTRQLIKE